ncbi:MAG: response regulator, partial [Sandarakinorhabdus sp.]|nr:response regulator [Sandarakinorhabdus sp.]
YCIGRDITGERVAAEKLSGAEAALRQAQKMEAIGQLTGGVAHDFNNLLTPIMGALDMLIRREIGSERERRMIDGALQSAERAKTLVQRLLAFARRQPLQAVAVDLATLVKGMAGLIASTVGPQIVVRVELDENLPPVSADANQLEMAILNLGVNARDAMPGGGALTITAVRESVRGEHRSGLDDGNFVRLSVADTGIGMDEDTLAHATEPFFSTKGLGLGTGLGLSMVHGLAAQLGGGLTIVSEPRHGTAVELWLPVSLDPLGNADEPSVTPTPVKSRLCALLVDDEALVRMGTADMLADMGYEVVEANSGEQALRLLDEGVAPDLLITDYLMPGMGGAGLVMAVRARKPGLPILIVSGYAEPAGIAPDLPRLTKPFRSADLAKSIASLARENAA